MRLHHICILLSLFASAAWAEAPASQPAAEDFPTSLDIRDYCTVLLAPKLQDCLRATTEQRDDFADLKTKLYTYLDNAAGNIRFQRPSPGLIAGRGETVLNMIGKMVRQELTSGQRYTLAAMFDDKVLQPIRISAAVEEGRSIRGNDDVLTGIHLDYTHYGEQGHATLTPTTDSTTQPAETDRDMRRRQRQLARQQQQAQQAARAHRGNQLDIQDMVEKLNAGNDTIGPAMRLGLARPEDKDRPAVLAALQPFVENADDESWMTYVKPYCLWANSKDEEKTLKTVLTIANRRKGFNRREEPAAAACTALLDIDAPVALSAINTDLLDNSMFRLQLSVYLQHRPGFSDGSNEIANNVYDQISHYRQGDKITAK